MLLVHAHPDDETIGSGITMARYAADGAAVTLVTCTSGEEGEVLVDDLAHLAAANTDTLGEHRRQELADAMDALGVTDHRFLGGPGRYRDSGMMGTPANDRPECFWRADLLDAATHLVEVIRQTRPQVLITYDDFGGYGHPDHIAAHRVAMYALVLAEAPSFRADLGAPWRIGKVYWTAFPKSVLRAGIAALRELGDDSPMTAMDVDDLPFGCDDAVVTTAITAAQFAPHKRAAMRAHATQIRMDEGFFALSNDVGNELTGTEFFRLVRGSAVIDPDGPDVLSGRSVETDLFAGLSADADG